MKLPKLLNFSKDQAPALTLQSHVIQIKWKHMVSGHTVIRQLLPWILHCSEN